MFNALFSSSRFLCLFTRERFLSCLRFFVTRSEWEETEREHHRKRGERGGGGRVPRGFVFVGRTNPLHFRLFCFSTLSLPLFLSRKRPTLTTPPQSLRARQPVLLAEALGIKMVAIRLPSSGRLPTIMRSSSTAAPTAAAAAPTLLCRVAGAAFQLPRRRSQASSCAAAALSRDGDDGGCPFAREETDAERKLCFFLFFSFFAKVSPSIDRGGAPLRNWRRLLTVLSLPIRFHRVSHPCFPLF